MDRQISVSFFPATIAPRELKFRILFRWYLVVNNTVRNLVSVNFGVRKDGLGHLPRKNTFSSITAVPAVRSGQMRTRLKVFSVRIVSSLGFMVIYACGLPANSVKVPKFLYTAWWYSIDQKFCADAEKSHGPQFETTKHHGFNGLEPAKVPKF
jgi:hypothetical protein